MTSIPQASPHHPRRSKEDEQKRLESPRAMSFGEKVFDTVVYGFMNYVGTFFATVPVAYELEFGRAKPLYDKAVNALKKTGVSENVARTATRVTTLMQGGNLMLFPILGAEKHKIGIVDSLNKWSGDQTDRSEIEGAPKQTLGNLVFSRVFLAWLPIFAGFVSAYSAFPDMFKRYEAFCGEKLRGFFKNASEKTKLAAYRYGEIGAWDVYATACSVSLLYIGSKFMLNKKDQEPAPTPHLTPQASGHSAEEAPPERAQEPEREDQKMALPPNHRPKAEVQGSIAHLGQTAPTPDTPALSMASG